MRLFKKIWPVACMLGFGCAGDPTPPASETISPAMAAVGKTPAAAPAAAAPATTDSAEASTPTEFQTTSSGLKYKIVKAGSDKRPTARDTVLCHYRGWLDDGTEFDSSYTSNKPIDFPLDGVIAGWTEGIPLIGEGGEIELEIPSDLGYGPGGNGSIPGGATLHFKVELIRVL